MDAALAVLGLLSFLIVMPFVAAIPALAFLAIYWRTRLISSLLAGASWALYGIYETLMYLRVLCSGECNIRIDLLLIYPLLILITLVAVLLWVWRWYRAGRSAQRPGT